MTLKKETGGVGKDATSSQKQKHSAIVKVNPKQEDYNPFRADKSFLLIPSWLLAVDVSLAAKLLYGLLRRYAGDRGFCYPGVKRLASELRVTPRRVTACLKELVDVPLIRRETRFIGSTVTYFVNPNDLEWVKETSSPPEGNFLTPLKETSSYKVKSKKVHSKGLVCPATAGAASGIEHPSLEEKKNASGLEIEQQETPLEFSGSKPDSSKDAQKSDAEVVELLFSFYPKVTDPAGTRIVLKSLVAELDDEELNYVGGITQFFANLVKPLKPHPKQWNYVPGSYNWFRKRIWDNWTVAQMKLWVSEKVKEIEDV